MKKVYKYPISLTDSQTLLMPKGASILTVQIQNNQLTIWAFVDLNQKMVERHFDIFGTGHDIDSTERVYIATCEVGGFVWHIFEKL